jgi:predicted MPP superfamily phosphohydrolase
VPTPPALRRGLQGLGVAGALGVGTLAYAALYEVDAYRLRRVSVPVLPAGSRDIRVLHVSDIHMTPSKTRRQRWLTELSGLEPDLVVDTGDNLAHSDAVPFVVRSLGRLLDVPGVYVWGSNDYYGPVLKNPLRYLTQRGRPANPACGSGSVAPTTPT